MSAEDKRELDRLKISDSTPVTLTGGNSIEISDAHESDIDEMVIGLEPVIDVIPGKNLANPATNITGFYIGANGRPTASENDWYTDLIPVSPGETVYVSGYHNQTDNGNKRLHGYDANGNWVVQLGYTAVAAGSYPPAYAYSFNVTVPSNSTVRYMRFSYRIADTQVMVQKGTNAPYEPYGENYEFSIHDTSLVISQSTNDDDYTYNLTIPAIYGGEVDVLNGVVKNTWGYIADYDGETLTGDWWSTHTNSSLSATPENGDEVIYELATQTTASFTGATISTDTGYNLFETSQGNFKVLTYEADGSIVSNLSITSGVITLGQTSLNEQQLSSLLALLS